MKNKSSISVLVTLTLSVCLFMAGSVQSQTTHTVYNHKNTSISGDVRSVSARIAGMYGADAQVVESFVQAAIDQESHSGIAAPVVIAIAIHESSFTSALFSSTGNPFGIKASSPWTGPTFSKWHDDEETRFRVYGTAEEAVVDFGDFIKSRTWYADALACPMDDYKCVLDGLKKNGTEPGYSISPDWDEAVLAIIEKIGLQTLAVR